MKQFLIKVVNWLDKQKVDCWRDFSLTIILTLLLTLFANSIKWIWVLVAISWMLYTIINALIIWKLDIDRDFNPEATLFGVVVGGIISSLFLWI